MASAQAMLERRRSSRVATRIPINIVDEGLGSVGVGLGHCSEAVGVSRGGALLRVSFSPVLGSRVQIQNSVSQETREFRVVRVSDARQDGLFELGVEILNPAQDFWGIRFPDEPARVEDRYPR